MNFMLSSLCKYSSSFQHTYDLYMSNLKVPKNLNLFYKEKIKALYMNLFNNNSL